MFKAIIPNDTTIIANTNIPLTVIKNTNRDISYDSTNKAIVFNNPGHYVIQYHIVTTDVAAGDITVSEVLNDTTSDSILSAGTSTATTDFISLDIPDILSIIPAMVGNTATLSYQSDVACTGTTGSLTIFKIGR